MEVDTCLMVERDVFPTNTNVQWSSLGKFQDISNFTSAA